jgi:hypothetical protein
MVFFKTTAELCEELQEMTAFDCAVYDRLVDVRDQLAALNGALPSALVEDYCSILWSLTFG